MNDNEILDEIFDELLFQFEKGVSYEMYDKGIRFTQLHNNVKLKLN